MSKEDVKNSQVQVAAMQYMEKRLKDLEKQMMDFQLTIPHRDNKEETYKEAIKIMGRILVEVALLSEVISEKDEKVIPIGKYILSLNDVIGKLPYLLIINCKDDKRKQYSKYAFRSQNPFGILFTKNTYGNVCDRNFITDADLLLMGALHQPYVEDLHALYEIGFIKHDMVEKDRRRIKCLDNGVGTYGDLHGFLKHYYKIKYLPEDPNSRLGSEIGNTQLVYLPRHNEESYLSADACITLGNICNCSRPLLQSVVEQFEEPKIQKPGRKM